MTLREDAEFHAEHAILSRSDNALPSSPLPAMTVGNPPMPEPESDLPAEFSETSRPEELYYREPPELAREVLHGGHALPLMPLRTRDLEVLVELFQQDGIEAIEADIVNNLLKRRPAPHWEELDSDLLHDQM